MWARVFGTTAMLFGMATLLAVFHWISPRDHTPELFVISLFFFTPFVVVFTRFGLNTAEGEPATLATQHKLDRLSDQCRWWPLIYQVCGGVVAISWLSFAAGYTLAHPFYAFSGAVSALSGLWFLLVHPTAKRLFLDGSPT